MVYAHHLFGEPRFLEAARRGVAFADRCFEAYGKIPLLLGLKPHEETEDSLTYFYGLETLTRCARFALEKPAAPALAEGGQHPPRKEPP